VGTAFPGVLMMETSGARWFGMPWEGSRCGTTLCANWPDAGYRGTVCRTNLGTRPKRASPTHQGSHDPQGELPPMGTGNTTFLVWAEAFCQKRACGAVDPHPRPNFLLSANGVRARRNMPQLGNLSRHVSAGPKWHAMVLCANTRGIVVVNAL